MNKDVKSRIEGYKYWDIFAEDIEGISDREVLRRIDSLMTNVQDEVTKRADAEDKDLMQTRKVVAGTYFQALVSYSTADTAAENGLRLLHNRQLSTTDLSGAVPSLGDEEFELSPDADIVYFDPSEDSGPIYILSCKTSFRERMAQSGMWKLLFESARYDCDDDDCPTHGYSFSDDFNRDIFMGFATADFYDDVESKEIVDLFDFGYAPSIESDATDDVVFPLTDLLDHLENRWADF